MRKSTSLIISGIVMLMITASACGSGAETEKTAADSVTVKPLDTAPAPTIDTTKMDSATTRPVKGTN